MRRVVFREDFTGKAPFQVREAGGGTVLASFDGPRQRTAYVHAQAVWDQQEWRVVDE